MRLPPRPRRSSTRSRSAVVPASAAVAIDVDVILPPDTAPDRVTHRIAYALDTDSKSAAMIDAPRSTGRRSRSTASRPSRSRSPVQGDGWLATTACCKPNVHRDLRIAVDGRRIDTAETFAVDWARAEGDRLYEGDGTTNEQFYAFGADVHAVADGTVVWIQDGKPEQTPGSDDGAGDDVRLRRQPGDAPDRARTSSRWYAHLQPGSLRVKVGDVVKAGAPLAKLGNTGPSLGPHLHFGVLDLPDSGHRTQPAVRPRQLHVGRHRRLRDVRRRPAW